MSEKLEIDFVNAHLSTIKQAIHLSPEVEEGNTEYKYTLTNLTDDQLTHRITQLNWRLNEGNDEAFYRIGVEDNGNPLGICEIDMNESLRNLKFIAEQVNCEMTILQLYAGQQGFTAEVWLRRRIRSSVDTIQVAVAMAGDVAAGKSTLVSVLCGHGLDNGSGLARSKIFTHNHEVESGRTSSISHHFLHFDENGGIISKHSSNSSQSTHNSKMPYRSVSLIDLAGHTKYMKTTLHGLMGRNPDRCVMCVSASTGLTNVTAEHLGVIMYLHVPLIVAITKSDCVDATTVDAICNTVKAVLSSLQLRGEIVTDESAGSPFANDVVPIVIVSNVTGRGVKHIRQLLNQVERAPKQAVEAASLPFPVQTFARILGTFGNQCGSEGKFSPELDDAFAPKGVVRHSRNKFSLGGESPLNLKPFSASRSEEKFEILPNVSPGPPPLLRHRSHSFHDFGGAKSSLVPAATQPVIVKHLSFAERRGSALSEFVDFVSTEGSNGDTPTSHGRVLILAIEHGCVSLQQQLLLGPTSRGQYLSVQVTSLRLNNFPIQFAGAGQTVTLKLTAVAGAAAVDASAVGDSIWMSAHRRGTATGLVLIAPQISNQLPSAVPPAYVEFDAELLVLNHPSKIKINYEPVVHIGSVRQAVRLVSIRKQKPSAIGDGIEFETVEAADGLSNGERGLCRFRFLYHPEFIIKGESMLIRELRTRGIGTITNVFS